MLVLKLERIFQVLFRCIPYLVEQKEKQVMIQCFFSKTLVNWREYDIENAHLKASRWNLNNFIILPFSSNHPKYSDYTVDQSLDQFSI